MIEIRSKQRSLIVLGALMGIMGLMALGVAGRNLYDRYARQSRDVPSIMILSRDLLSDAIVANTAADQLKLQNKKFTTDILKDAAPNQARDARATGQAAGVDRTQGSDTHEDRNLQLQLLKSSMGDGIALSISDLLRHSHLFNPIAGGLVAGQLAQLHQTRDAELASAGGKASGPATKVSDTERATRAAARAQVSDPTLATMAHNLDAQYVLTVAVTEPDLRVRILPGDKSTPQVHAELSARPIVHVEVFAVGGKGFSDSKEIMLPGAISRNVPLRLPLIETNVESDVSEASAAIAVEVDRRVAQAVVEWLVNEAAPARVVLANNGQFTIDRGSNDGVRVGAVYPVLREVGDDVSGGGVDGAQRSLGKQRIPVGSITISGIDTLKSYGTVASGGPFKQGDVVAMTGSGSGGGTADVPLGTQELARAGVAAGHKVQLAVDDINYSAEGRSGDSDQLGELISAALARDPRVTVIPRAEMQNVVAERDLNAQSSGDQDAGGVQGMATSNYLVSGSFSSASSRHNRTISAGGVTENLSSYMTTAVSGTLRVTSTGGVLKYTTSVSGGSPQEVAQAAARALLVMLFPTQVVEVSGQMIVLDRGQDVGMRVGTRLSLFHVGSPIVDKMTGAVHEGVRIPAGEAIVQSVQPTLSTAQLQGTSSAREGDIVLTGGGGRTDALAPGAAPHRVTHRAPRPADRAAPAHDEGLHF
ncbi:hypothetical protein [Novosphingobium sp. FSW06-99]|uniref:hypothetical protein n=1 Tax=Novosphingobium sp. FSW06-99 TaxID=1739113 RepID=UPI000AF5360E|nr:hypothetical protein [Novosphingobium sp. FSW06-99]